MLGLTTDDPGAHAVLQRAFASLVTEANVPVNLTVRLGTDPTQFHVLSWGTCPALRTLDVDRLAVGLRRFVGGHGAGPAGTVRTDFAAVVRDGGAVLVHRDFRERLVKDERTLRRGGLSVLEAPYADVDLTTGELVVSDPDVPVDDRAMEELRSLAPPRRRADPAVPPGRYHLVGAVVAGHPAGAELPPPQAAFALLRRVSVALDEAAAETALAALAGLTARVTVVQAESAEEARDQALHLGGGVVTAPT